jgi:hypothetical protein
MAITQWHLHNGNNAFKGKNAYYYAHASTGTGPKWDGDPTPRLLETKTKKMAAPAVGGGGGGGEGGGDVVLGPVEKKIAKFAWGDEEGKVRKEDDGGDNGAMTTWMTIVTDGDDYDDVNAKW